MLVADVLPPAVDGGRVAGLEVAQAVGMDPLETFGLFLGQVLDHVRPHPLERLHIIQGRKVKHLAVGDVQVQQFRAPR